MAILLYFAALSIGYTLFLIGTIPEINKKFKEIFYGNISTLLDQENLVPLTIVIPAFNEEKRIKNSVYSVLKSNYKNIDVIVVADGPQDKTLSLLIEEFSLYEIPVIIRQVLKTMPIKHLYKSKTYKNLMVIDKEHSPANCAADAVNAGLNACQTPIMLTVDADTIIEPNSLPRILFAFLSQPHCVTVGGAVYIVNTNTIKKGKLLERNLPNKIIPAIQALEYFRSFFYGRAGWNYLAGALSFSGTFTLFETEALHEVKGFDTKNFAYDSEIIMQLHDYMGAKKYPHRVYYTPNAFAWTEVPSTLRRFWHQRNLWQRGLLRSISEHIHMFLNPKYGVVGLVGFPFYVIFEVFGPPIEFTSYILLALGYWLGIVTWEIIFWFVALAWGYITLLSIGTYFLNMITFNHFNKLSDVIKIVWLAIIEMLGFRQFRALCAFYSTFEYLIRYIIGKDP